MCSTCMPTTRFFIIRLGSWWAGEPAHWVREPVNQASAVVLFTTNVEIAVVGYSNSLWIYDRCYTDSASSCWNQCAGVGAAQSSHHPWKTIRKLSGVVTVGVVAWSSVRTLLRSLVQSVECCCRLLCRLCRRPPQVWCKPWQRKNIPKANSEIANTKFGLCTILTQQLLLIPELWCRLLWDWCDGQ